jgi:uncharacterized membrane protein
MAAVYSTNFLAIYQDSSTEGTYVYDVPAGYLAVVRSLTISCLSAPSGANGQISLKNGAVVLCQQWLPLSTDDFVSWNGRHVLEAGDSITAVLSPGLHAYASGYLLTLP